MRLRSRVRGDTSLNLNLLHPLTLISVSLCLCALLLPQSLHAQEWYVSYEKGLDAVKNQQWQEAVRYLSDAIAEQDESKASKRTYGMQFIDYFPYVYRGVAYYRLGDRAKALADLEKAEGESSVPTASNDATAAKLLRDYLDLLRKPAPTPQTDAAFAEGVRLYNQRDYKGAIAKLQEVSNTSPRYADAGRYIKLADTELKKAEAAADLKDKKDRAEKAFATGVQYFNQKNLDQAEEAFQSVLQLDATRADARRYLGRITDLRRSAAPTATAQRETAKETPHTSAPPAVDTTAQMFFRQAVALFTGGKIGEAKAQFQSLRRTDPSNGEIGTYLQSIADIESKTRKGIAAYFEGDYQKAIDQLTEAGKARSDSPTLYAFLACSYAAQYLLTGEDDGALRRNAVDAFGRTKQMDAGYVLDGKFISPRIIAMLNGR
ncbi:MAG: hypothetical protein AB1428_09895 [Bacteroidota bacterium]